MSICVFIASIAAQSKLVYIISYDPLNIMYQRELRVQLVKPCFLLVPYYLPKILDDRVQLNDARVAKPT